MNFKLFVLQNLYLTNAIVVLSNIEDLLKTAFPNIIVKKDQFIGIIKILDAHTHGHFVSLVVLGKIMSTYPFETTICEKEIGL